MPTTTKPHLALRLGWFALFWLGGVVAVGAVAALLKLLL